MQEIPTDNIEEELFNDFVVNHVRQFSSVKVDKRGFRETYCHPSEEWRLRQEWMECNLDVSLEEDIFDSCFNCKEFEDPPPYGQHTVSIIRHIALENNFLDFFGTRNFVYVNLSDDRMLITKVKSLEVDLVEFVTQPMPFVGESLFIQCSLDYAVCKWPPFSDDSVDPLIAFSRFNLGNEAFLVTNLEELLQQLWMLHQFPCNLDVLTLICNVPLGRVYRVQDGDDSNNDCRCCPK